MVVPRQKRLATEGTKCTKSIKGFSVPFVPFVANLLRLGRENYGIQDPTE
jgi:hypothetical protein